MSLGCETLSALLPSNNVYVSLMLESRHPLKKYIFHCHRERVWTMVLTPLLQTELGMIQTFSIPLGMDIEGAGTRSQCRKLLPTRL